MTDTMDTRVKSKKKVKPRQEQYDEYYKERWFRADQEKNKILDAVRVLIEAIDVPYHSHDTD